MINPSVCLSFHLYVTRWHCVKTAQAHAVFTVGQPHELFLHGQRHANVQMEHRERGRRTRQR